MELRFNQSLDLQQHSELSREWEVQTAVTSVAATPQSLELEWPTVKLLVLADGDLYYNFGLLDIAGGGVVDTTNDMKIMADVPTPINIPWGAINLAQIPKLLGGGRSNNTKLYFVS